MNRQDEKERRRQARIRQERDNYTGMTERLERNFLKLGLGALLVYILFICAMIGALIALIIYLV